MSELIVEISKLTIAERIELIQVILQTISKEASDVPASALTDEQLEEIEQRSASIALGNTKTVAWDEIQAKLKQRYGL